MVTIINKDALTALKELPDNSVDSCVCSPPYSSLRIYNCPIVWGGSKDCKHDFDFVKGAIDLQSGSNEFKRPWRENASDSYKSGYCKCGVWYGELGQEPTPEFFIDHLVEIFGEVKRVLKPTGNIWINISDSFWGSWGNSGNRPYLDGKTQNQRDKNVKDIDRKGWVDNRNRPPSSYPHSILKPKDLVGVPWMLSFALRDRLGLWLRNDIIWQKRSPLPESVNDRLTRSHEYVFLFAKSSKYYFDIEAIKEPIKDSSLKRINQKSFDTQTGGAKDFINNDINTNRIARKTVEKFKENCNGLRQKRDVWELSNEPSRDEHYAAYPQSLVEPCIKAGCPKECCAKCGAPYVRVVEKEDQNNSYVYKAIGIPGEGSNRGRREGAMGYGQPKVDKGFNSSCICNTDKIKGVVIDPFGGSGTTSIVAEKQYKDSILIEPNKKYVEIAKRRLKREIGMFMEIKEL